MPEAANDSLYADPGSRIPELLCHRLFMNRRYAVGLLFAMEVLAW